MARPIDLEKKRVLRERAAEHLLRHGLSGFSLRPLAKALGTSARMLVHHFGSREALLHEALDAIRARERAALDAWRRGHAAARSSPRAVLLWHWQRLAAPRMRPQLRQLFELYAFALREPQHAQWAIEAPLAYWVDVLAGSGDASRARAATRATLVLATLRGLLLDLASSGETARIDQALRAFAASLRRPARAVSKRKRRA